MDKKVQEWKLVYRPECFGAKGAFIPIEFATAAYRFGHTMIPQQLSVQPGGPKHDVFGPTLGIGFQPITSPDAVVDWETLLDSGSGQFERAGRLDVKLAKLLLALPFIPPTVPAFERSLAVRNLLRAQSFLIPSGERIARFMVDAGADEITTEMISEVREAGNKLGFAKATPFWIYVLAEGQIIGRMDENSPGQKKFSKGEGLGPVGARFVAEVILGLLELDSRSFLGANRNWSPLDSGDKIGPDGVTTLYQLLTA